MQVTFNFITINAYYHGFRLQVFNSYKSKLRSFKIPNLDTVSCEIF